MSTLSPTQQKIQQRSQRILETARPILIQHGYHGLSMDRIARELDYSKGTIYNHFANKEEVIVALAIETVSKRVDLFKQAAQFKGKSRYRMLAIAAAAEKFVREYPDFFILEQILQLPSIREKISEKREFEINNCEATCMSVVAGVVRDAIAAEDLDLASDFSPEKVVFGFWALSSGGFAIAARSESLPHLGLDQPFELVHAHTLALLDGLQWKPLSPDYDDQEIMQRVQREVFNDE